MMMTMMMMELVTKVTILIFLSSSLSSSSSSSANDDDAAALSPMLRSSRKMMNMGINNNNMGIIINSGAGKKAGVTSTRRLPSPPHPLSLYSSRLSKSSYDCTGLIGGRERRVPKPYPPGYEWEPGQLPFMLEGDETLGELLQLAIQAYEGPTRYASVGGRGTTVSVKNAGYQPGTEIGDPGGDTATTGIETTAAAGGGGAKTVTGIQTMTGAKTVTGIQTMTGAETVRLGSETAASIGTSLRAVGGGGGGAYTAASTLTAGGGARTVGGGGATTIATGVDEDSGRRTVVGAKTDIDGAETSVFQALDDDKPNIVKYQSHLTTTNNNNNNNNNNNKL
eukprot:jgi/Bigna1/146023/aug1.107_g20731